MADVSGWAPRPGLNEHAADYILQMIATGRVHAGDPLKADSIAAEMGISVTPVREALHVLRVEGLVDLMPRKAFVVAPLSGKDVRDLFVAQALLAGELASRAAEVATPEDVIELDALNDAVVDAMARQDAQELECKNLAFHAKVADIADSRKIVWADTLLGQFIPRLFRASIVLWLQSTKHDHSEIVDGIRSRDPARARAAMYQHVVDSGEILAKHVSSSLLGTEDPAPSR